MQNNIEQNMIIGSEILGIKMEIGHLLLFQRYLSALEKWNQKLNLTSITNSKEICVKHFLDSLTALNTVKKCILYKINRNSQIDIIDVGTGAGFPGIPIKIMLPSLRLALLEAKKKKINFLIELVKDLGLKEVNIVNDRAEIVGRKDDFRECYDISISRAVAPLAVLYEYALPLIKKNGWFIALKGRKYKDDLGDGMSALELLGGKLFNIEKIQLPILNQERNIISIRKIKNTPDKYPRKAGLPKKRPLNI